MMQDASLAAEIGAQFDQVLVDEYQDTNRVQAGILKQLRPDGAGLTVVGDDAQAIYAFRAATVENILAFPAQYAPAAASVTLEVNALDAGRVDAANALIGEGASMEGAARRAAPAAAAAGDGGGRAAGNTSRAVLGARAVCRSSARRCSSGARITATRSSSS
jgi:superfamily I DNA/RNA helicase